MTTLLLAVVLAAMGLDTDIRKLCAKAFRPCCSMLRPAACPYSNPARERCAFDGMKMQLWAAILAVLSFVCASGGSLAKPTIVLMTVATALMTVAVLWPLVEKPLIRVLRV